MFAQLGDLGLLSLPYPERYGGGDQPAVVYLQVLEELARGWATVALGVSVHVLACSGVAEFGTRRAAGAVPAGDARRVDPGRLLPVRGARRIRCRGDAHPRGLRGDEYVITGDKAWITHGPVADFYLLAARTGDDRSHGISTFLLPHGHPGLTAGTPERKMGFRGSATSTLHLDQVRVGADRRIGYEGQGFRIALSALDSGRLGISACAVGLAQAALDAAADYAADRIGVPPPDRRIPGSVVPAGRCRVADRRRPGSCTCTPRGARTPASRSPPRRRWPS